jgi:hypothetical protein
MPASNPDWYQSDGGQGLLAAPPSDTTAPFWSTVRSPAGKIACRLEAIATRIWSDKRPPPAAPVSSVKDIPSCERGAGRGGRSAGVLIGLRPG